MLIQAHLSPLVSQSSESLIEDATTTTSIPSPPEAVYSSQEELYSAIQSWAVQHRYSFRIGRSKKIRSGFRTKVLYNCDRYGPPPPVNQPQSSSQARKRKTSSRNTECQF